MSEEEEFTEGKNDLETKGTENDEMGNILEKAMSFCFSEGFSKIFEDFMKKHCKHFDDSLDSEFGTEHTVKQKTLYDEYLQLFQGTIEDWLEKNDITENDFQKALKSAKESEDSGAEFFLKLLQASTEFECFFDVMQSEARFKDWQKDQKTK